MRLTTKGRFAVTAMLDLALCGGGQAVSLTAVSERRGISLSYLEQLFGKLRRAGLVESVRGPGGGYILSRAADAVNIADIIRAAEDTLDATGCGGSGNCHNDGMCITHDLWTDLNKTVDDYLSGITLQTVINKQKERATRDVPVFASRPQTAAVRPVSG